MCEVSIIMPVYNKEKYVARAIESVLHQTFQDWELIIIDDGSTDRSFEISEKYQSSKVHIIHQKNAGASSARNLGLSKAEGEWIWFIDADDVSEPNFLEKAVSYSDGVDIVAGGFYKAYEDGRHEPILIEDNRIYDADDFIDIFMRFQYKNGYWGYLWNKIIRRNFIIQVGAAFSRHLTLAEDLKFMVEVYKAGAVVRIIPCYAMRYTVDAVNSSKQFYIDYRAQMEIQYNIYDWIVNHNKREEYRDQLRQVISYYAAFIVYYAYEDGEDYLKEAASIIRDRRIYPLLDARGIKAPMHYIIIELKQRNLKRISRYLNVRNSFRFVYRKLKNIWSK